MCKYCNPSDERKKNYNWEYLDSESSLNMETGAYIVPATEHVRACLVFYNGNRLVDIVLNYCPICGEKLPE